MNAVLAAAAPLLAVGAIIAVLYRPLGDYIARTFTSARHGRVETWIYRVAGIDPDHAQTWRQYLGAVLWFSAVGLVLFFAIEVMQPLLPFSRGLPPMSPDLAFNTAASFVANTNWQAYAPEQTTGYAVQLLALTVQMFVSCAVGLAVAIALTRGIAASGTGLLGSFWVDVTRGTLRLLVPLSVLAAVVFVAGGVVQNFGGFTEVATLTGGAQQIPGGPAAAHEAIKFIGTNGGGFYNANSAHPFENPTAWTNAFQVLLFLVIPFCLARTFGTMVGDQRLAAVLVTVMSLLFVGVYVGLVTFELLGAGTAPELAGAAVEGKEQRLGVIQSMLFGAATTGTSGGAANSALGSYTALSGMILMLNMMVGEVSPGGVGAGLYTLLMLLMLTVFLTALSLGRAPMVLGKRVRLLDVKIISAFLLVMPTLALASAAVVLSVPSAREELIAATGNPGSHGLSEILYAFVSAAINNGSAFAGLSADISWLNVTLGIVILLGRFIPIAMVLALAGSFATQTPTVSAGSALPLHRPQFVVFFLSAILLIALPMFFPYLLVGPVAEGLG